jgi:tRNA 2-thiouridine synthesizing protein A
MSTTPAPDPLVVDARGLNCPMPVIELAKAVRDVAVGDEVTLLATDSTSRVDVPVWCRMQRQQLIEAHEALDEAGTNQFRFVVRKAAAGS